MNVFSKLEITFISQNIIHAKKFAFSQVYNAIFVIIISAFFNKNKPAVKKAGCEYCYLVVPSTNKEKFLPLTDVGKFQIELTWYNFLSTLELNIFIF